MSGKPTLVLADERRREIVSIARKEGRVAVGELALLFDVSPVTLRSDLRQLADKGVLVRAYGDAMLPLEAKPDFPLKVKETVHRAEKARIGQAAANLIRSHQTVILNSGSTSAEVARALKRRNLDAVTVITHALNIAQEFTGAPNISVIMLGGLLRHVSASFVGPQAERMIREMHADHLFLGVDGIHPEAGLSTPDLLEAQLNTAMMQVAQEVTVVADTSKMGRRSLSLIAGIHQVHRVIAGAQLDSQMAAALRRQGVELITV